MPSYVIRISDVSSDVCSSDLLAVEDVGILDEGIENQPVHEMIHLGPAFGGSPIMIVFQQFDIEPIEPGRGADVKGAIAHLLDGADARQGQEEAEKIGRE